MPSFTQKALNLALNQSKFMDKIVGKDFTQNSDIDWSKSISDIDQQLFKKYKLNKEEIAFIEENVQPMV